MMLWSKEIHRLFWFDLAWQDWKINRSWREFISPAYATNGYLGYSMIINGTNINFTHVFQLVYCFFDKVYYFFGYTYYNLYIVINWLIASQALKSISHGVYRNCLLYVSPILWNHIQFDSTSLNTTNTKMPVCTIGRVLFATSEGVKLLN